ncbi:MAG: hypothetical protein M1469_07110 [Bacteroidetes bacterium]|nr:hypothetical protein [Bacteroidota bacterium]
MSVLRAKMRMGFVAIFLLIIENMAHAQGWDVTNGTFGDYISAITMYQSDPDTMYALGGGHQLGPSLFRSVDGGASWDTIGAQAPGGFGSDVGALKVDPNDSHILYASVFGYDLAKLRLRPPSKKLELGTVTKPQ